MPELLAHTSLDPESMAVLKDNIQQFLQCVPVFRFLDAAAQTDDALGLCRWMDLNRRVLFLPEYIGTSSGYQNNNRG